MVIFPLENGNILGVSLLYIFEREAPERGLIVTLWLSVLWDGDISPKEYLSSTDTDHSLTQTYLDVYLRKVRHTEGKPRMQHLHELKAEVEAKAKELLDILEKGTAHEFSLARAHVEQALHFIEKHVLREAALVAQKSGAAAAAVQTDAETAEHQIEEAEEPVSEEPTEEPVSEDGPTEAEAEAPALTPEAQIETDQA